MKNILYIGLDVDDKTFHGAGLCEKSEEIFEFSSRPNAASLLKKPHKSFFDRLCQILQKPVVDSEPERILNNERLDKFKKGGIS